MFVVYLMVITSLNRLLPLGIVAFRSTRVKPPPHSCGSGGGGRWWILEKMKRREREKDYIDEKPFLFT